MIQIKLLVFVSCLLISSVSFPACVDVNYDYQILALTWPNQYCSQNTCDRNWYQKWDGHSFFIHGFWPSSTNLAYLSCLQQRHDPYCYRDYRFSLSAFSSAQKADLNKYWPELRSKMNFWSYEWNKHGTCFLHIIKDQYKSNQSDREIMREYFIQTINKVKDLRIQLNKGKISTKNELANKINLHPTQFYAICGDDNQLDEIRICYDIYYIPGEEYIIDCPTSRDRSQCSFPIVIK